MTVLSGDFLLLSFKGHMHAKRYVWYVWLKFLYCNIETNKAANAFLKRVAKEIMIINMKDVCVHFLYSWLEF